MNFFNIFKVDREKQKDTTINYIVSSIVENVNKYDHTEQTEIFNRVTLRLMERKKEERTRLLKETRELQDSMRDMRINKVD